MEGKRPEPCIWEREKSTETSTENGTVTSTDAAPGNRAKWKNKKKKRGKYQPEPSLYGHHPDDGDGKKTVPGMEKEFAPGHSSV